MSVEFLSLADCRLAYQRQVGSKDKPGVIFLSGFASDMEGGKASFLAERCARHSISFIRFDYSGCGLSSGNFADGTIGQWYQDSVAVFKQLTEGPQIIVGSSMGGWLGILLAKSHPSLVKAFIGIAAAPDFTEDLIWEKLTGPQRDRLLREKKIYDEDTPSEHQIPMTLKLIEEARDHLVLRPPLSLSCPIRLMQGMQDKEVPWQFASRIINHIDQSDARALLIKNGDHRLSTPENLEVLWQMIAEFI